MSCTKIGRREPKRPSRAGKRSRLADLSAQYELASNVVSTHDGLVVEVLVSKGDVVTVNQPVLSVEAPVKLLEALIYMPPQSEAKRIKPGMMVQLSPATAPKELSVEERIQLQHDVAEGKIPYVLSPFTEVEDIEPSISVGVRHHGEVVAWMIVTRSPLVTDALCYRSTFVRPHLRAAQALSPLILAAALRRHVASPIVETRPVGVYGMSFDSSTKMINFFRKRLAPYCFSTYESRGSMKRLAQALAPEATPIARVL